MDIYGYILDQNLWAGRSLKGTLFIYYLFLTKKYIVYVQSEQLYYQYDGKRWQIRPPSTVINDLAGWLSKVSVKGVDKVINPKADTDLLNKFQSVLTIEKWPYVMGHNLGNGFLTLENGRYVLLPHSPAFWKKHLINIPIPPEIIPKIPPKTFRLALDTSSEGLVNATLLKLILCLVVEEGNHNLIINYCGNPRGAKTLVMDFISDILGHAYKIGRFKGMNAFGREQMMLNSRVIAFPDANPTNIDSDGIDVLKSLAGRDKVQVDHQHGDPSSVKTNALIIITNNEDFDAVPAYKEEALADRVMNFVAPSIRSHTMVPDLKQKLEPEGITALFWFALTIDPEILYRAQRSGEFNAVTGSGAEKAYIQFLVDHCVFSHGARTTGQDLHKVYRSFWQTVDKKKKPDSAKTFYKKLEHFVDKVTPRGVERVKRNKGVTFRNLLIGTPGKVKQSYQRFTYQGTEEMQNLLNRNCFKAEHIIFRDHKGDYIKGPRIDPAITDEMFETITDTKDTNLKAQTQGNCPVTIQKHFETTGFGGGEDVHSLKKSDFEEKSPILYQPRLQYGILRKQRITDLANFGNSALSKHLRGQLQPILLIPHANPQASPKIEGISEDYKWLGEFRLNSDLFISEEEDYHQQLMKESKERITKARIGPPGEVKLKRFFPKGILDSNLEAEETNKMVDSNLEETKGMVDSKGRKKRDRTSKKSKSQRTALSPNDSSETADPESSKSEGINEYFVSKGF